MRIIPAIDILDGNCVRLSQGDYSTEKKYSSNPVEMAKSFEDAGIKYLHLVDLDGARSNGIVNHKILNAIATKTKLVIDFGGGMKTADDIIIAFESGANQITAGSIAIKNPLLVEEWIASFGNDRILLGADCRNRKIAMNGWLETDETDVIDYINTYVAKGIRSIICTDISKDGMLNGPATTLYNEILGKTDVKLIASGGISSVQDILDLKALGCEGVIVGKAIYEGRITLNQLVESC